MSECKYPDTIFTPIIIGPTWQTTEDGNWLLPEHTIGWEGVQWATEYLNADDCDEESEPRRPWKFTMEQLRLILWWYAVDERGRFIYRKGVLQRLKGWGKDPLAAVIALIELCGPSQFSHWGEDGKPVAKVHPRAWVQIAAVSKTQTINTMAMFPAIMSKKFIADYHVEAGAELIKARGGRVRLVAVTSNYRTLEGGRSTFVILNETHHWIAANGGVKMYQTVDGNVTKGDVRKGFSRYLAITNAYLPGEESVAEMMRESYEKVADGRAVDAGMLYDSLEAHESAPLDPEVLPRIIEAIRGDATWLDPESIIQSILDTSISASRSRRMWLNQIVAEEDAVYQKSQWTALRRDGALAKGDTIVLGFDGGKTDDATALVAIRVADRFVQPIVVLEKPDGPQGEGWVVNTDIIDSAVHEAFRLYNVVGFYADVALWESHITEWAEHYGEGLLVKSNHGRNAIAWDMRSSQKASTMAHEQLMNAVLSEKLSHNGDPVLQRHVLNARRATNNFGLSFRKESPDSAKKVDAYAAMLLAYTALTDYLARGKKAPKKGGRVYAI